MEGYRFKVVKQLEMPPWQCSLCSSSSPMEYVDLGLDIDSYGTVYICTKCLKDINKETGVEGTIVKKEVPFFVVQRLTGLSNTLNLLISDIGRIFNDRDSSSTSSDNESSDPDGTSVSESSRQSSTAINSIPEGNDSGTNEGKERPTKSTAKSGSKNISSPVSTAYRKSETITND